ncbi:MAG TPA: hypothetical protein VHY08_22680 [Bacillota bacterium]|nr:hypothetical protein [Bacillota bacterium]
MKRMIVLGMICVLVLFSLSALADDAQNYLAHEEDLGVVINTTINGANTNLAYVHDREGTFTPDVNGAAQSTELTLNAQAYIPCYLKMVVTGNTGRTSLESFGPGAEAAKQEGAYTLFFDNEIGGFVTSDWTVVGHGRNAEIQPGTGHYIRGCDIFKVELYSNDTYKYEVTSQPLTTNDDADTSSSSADKTLDLQMRTKIDSADWGTTWSFGTNGQECPISQKAACESTTVFHDFRVPYLSTTAHGQYNGLVVLKAYTL